MSFFDCFPLLNRRSLRKNISNESSNRDTPRITSHTLSATDGIVSPSPSGVNSNTNSKPSATPQHRYDGGRRFHDNEKVSYLLPDDVEEDDRIHLQHWALGVAFGSNFDAPVHHALEEGINVLDSGCGPATWTLEVANAYPNSKFYGTDVSTRFPNDIKPGNCEFLIHNILDEPPFEENYFGFIHQRLLVLGIKMADWPKVLENLKYSLKPGGWIELTELSYKWEKLGPKGRLATDTMTSAAGLDPDLGTNLPQLLSDAGFTNIQKRLIDIPINHGGKVGELFWEDFKQTFMSAKPIFCKMHPEFQEPGAYEKFVDEVGEEYKNNKMTTKWTRAFAQKPFPSNT